LKRTKREELIDHSLARRKKRMRRGAQRQLSSSTLKERGRHLQGRTAAPSERRGWERRRALAGYYEE